MAFRHAEHVMGTVFSIDVRDSTLGAEVLAPVVRRLHEIDERYSTYRPGSLINRIQRGAISMADAPPEIRSLLDECERWRECTGGWFDVRAAGRLDPSGYVKGWAVAQASELLCGAGSRRHCVNGGGDIQAVGTDRDEPWTFGIIDPTDETRLLGTVAGTSLAVATSGVTRRGAHIIDPMTGRVATGALLSLSVVGRSIIDCDVLATAGVAMGNGAEKWFGKRLDVQTLGVRTDARIFTTPSLPDRIRSNQ